MRRLFTIAGCLAGATLVWSFSNVRSMQPYTGEYKSSGYKFFRSLSIAPQGQYSMETGGGCDVYTDEQGNMRLPSKIEEGKVLAFGDCLILCPTSEKHLGPPEPDLGRCSPLETAKSVSSLGTSVFSGELNIADGLSILTGVRVLRPISWGARHYLVNDIGLFSQAINEDSERKTPDDSYQVNRSAFLRVGDEGKPAPGRPELPGLWQTSAIQRQL
ncbi:MAG: hypothetical protein K2X93_13330 [Candidatus Obscuribacterales bacterium]|nr:hypothetical protein [Candidatus Obscuribacterales bacterium]